jgi:hypothetical protein
MNATRAAQQRVERPDEAPVGGDVDRHDVVPGLWVEVVKGGEQAQDAGIADKGVEPAPAAVERFSQPVDCGEVAQIHRNQGRSARL